jgi:Xaa-Pro aminopeptidase
LKRLGEFLDRHRLDGVLLTRRDHFSWITCGRQNYIANNTGTGVTSILATRDGRRTCLANAIEAPRMSGEELVGTGIETVSFPWYDRDAAKKTVGEVIGGRKIATDGETFGLDLPPLPGDFAELRFSLTPEEIARYREGGKRAAKAMERACREIRPGMTEHEAAGLLDYQIHNVGSNPLVTLVSSDERVMKFRHPIPTDRIIREHVMLVTCASYAGLIANVTRFVRFTPPTEELKSKHQAVCNVDAAVNLATRAGRTLGEIFDDLRRAYADNGFPDEWKLHHQGGPTGYATRDAVGRPGHPMRVVENQAFAWNPSITGAKSEDTVLCTPNGIEVLTAHSNDWPSVTGRADNHELRRADVLVVS